MPEPLEQNPLGILAQRLLKTLNSNGPIGYVLLALPAFVAIDGWRLVLAVNPGVRQISNLGERQQFIAAKTGRRFPFVAVLVIPGQRDVEPRPIVPLVRPNRGFDAAKTDFVCRPSLAVFLGRRRRLLRTVLYSHGKTFLS